MKPLLFHEPSGPHTRDSSYANPFLYFNRASSLRGSMRLLCVFIAAGHLGARGARGAATPEKCEQWAREGECVNNYKFMLVECRAACASDARAPPSPEHDCRSWAEADECSKNVKFMHRAMWKSNFTAPRRRRALSLYILSSLVD